MGDAVVGERVAGFEDGFGGGVVAFFALAGGEEIRGGNPDPLPFMDVIGPDKALELFRTWIAKGYLRVCEDGESTELLPNGSWFIQKMISDAFSALTAPGS